MVPLTRYNALQPRQDAETRTSLAKMLLAMAALSATCLQHNAGGTLRGLSRSKSRPSPG